MFLPSCPVRSTGVPASYNTWMSYPPMHGDYFCPDWAAPRRSTHGTYSNNNDRFNQKNRSDPKRRGKVVKQVYQIKKGQKDVVFNDTVAGKSGEITESEQFVPSGNKNNGRTAAGANNSNEATVHGVFSTLSMFPSTLATKHADIRQPKTVILTESTNDFGIKEIVPKLSLLSDTKPQPRWCPLRLSHSQKRRLQKLSEQELKEMTMAWVPKGIIQIRDMEYVLQCTFAKKKRDMDDGRASIPIEATGAEIKKELPLKSKSQPRCPLGLSSWQEKKLRRLSAEELKKRNMAWVLKGTDQIRDKDDGRASVPMEAVRLKKKGVKKQLLSQRLASDHYYLGPSYHPYSLAMPLGPMSWSPFSGMSGYPSWSYYNPWMQSSYHGGISPNYYT